MRLGLIGNPNVGKSLIFHQLTGIGVEVMDTLAAARTYNILVAEGRAVAAALLLPDAAP